MPIDTDIAINALRELVRDCGEVWQKTVFTVKTDDHDITVTIYDGGGSGNPHARYYATARADGRKPVVGNLSESVFGALNAVHWDEVA